MFISEATKTKGKLFSLMESLDVYTEYHPSMVPIMESQDKQHLLLNIQDLTQFAEANNYRIDDAIMVILETHSIDDPNDVVFTLQEEKAIEDPSLLELATAMRNSDYPVSISPISNDDIISKIGSYCLEQAEKTNDYQYWIGSVFLGEAGPNWNEYQDMKAARRKVKKAKSVNDFTAEELEAALRYEADPNADIPAGGRPILNVSHLKELLPPEIRAELYKNPAKLFKAGLVSYDQANLIHNLARQAQTQDEVDPISIENYVMGRTPEVDFMQLGKFNRGDMDVENPNLTPEQIKERKAKQQKIVDSLNNFNRGNEIIDKGGDLFNDSKSREDESHFNKMKDQTKQNLSFLQGEVSRLKDYEGMMDKDAGNRVAELMKMVDQEKFPKSWLAKKIAWLRSLYRNLMYKLSLQKSNTPIIGHLKRFAGFVLRCIDKLALKLQNAVS